MTVKVTVEKKKDRLEAAKEKILIQSPEQKRGETVCYRIMSILEQNEETREKERAKMENRLPREVKIKQEYYKTGQNEELRRFLNRTHLTYEIFNEVGKGVQQFDPKQRSYIAEDLDVRESDIWY